MRKERTLRIPRAGEQGSGAAAILPGVRSGSLKPTTHAHGIDRLLEHQIDRAGRNSPDRLAAAWTMVLTLAHELTQPITSTGNYLAMLGHALAESPDSEELAYVVERASNAIGRASEIIRAARALAEVGNPRTAQVPLESRVENALDLVRADEDSADLEVRTDYRPRGLVLSANPVQVEQILYNILRNALQAMRGSPTKILSITARLHGPTAVEIRIQDSGPGLPGGDPANLFQAFATPWGEGLGVGLALTKILVEANGGRIWAENAPQGGAILTFTLPLEESDQPRARD